MTSLFVTTVTKACMASPQGSGDTVGSREHNGGRNSTGGHLPTRSRLRVSGQRHRLLPPEHPGGPPPRAHARALVAQQNRCSRTWYDKRSWVSFLVHQSQAFLLREGVSQLQGPVRLSQRVLYKQQKPVIRHPPNCILLVRRGLIKGHGLTHVFTGDSRTS